MGETTKPPWSGPVRVLEGLSRHFRRLVTEDGWLADVDADHADAIAAALNRPEPEAVTVRGVVDAAVELKATISAFLNRPEANRPEKPESSGCGCAKVLLDEAERYNPGWYIAQELRSIASRLPTPAAASVGDAAAELERIACRLSNAGIAWRDGDGIRSEESRVAEVLATLAAKDAELARLREENERLTVQLAGCGVAAMDGSVGQEAPRDAYGWSPAYESVLQLRRDHDAQLKRRSDARRAVVELCSHLGLLVVTVDEAV